MLPEESFRRRKQRPSLYLLRFGITMETGQKGRKGRIMKIVIMMEDTCGNPLCECEHGLSIYIETKNHKILMDAGAGGKTLFNAQKSAFGDYFHGDRYIGVGHCTGQKAVDIMRPVLGDRLTAMYCGMEILI